MRDITSLSLQPWHKPAQVLGEVAFLNFVEISLKHTKTSNATAFFRPATHRIPHKHRNSCGKIASKVAEVLSNATV